MKIILIMRIAVPEEAGIALAKLCEVIDLGVRASSDFFGSGKEPVSEHMIQPHQEFIDDINQEV